MPMQDGFDPAQPLPQFLAEPAQPEAGNARDEAVKPSPVFKAGSLIVATAATGIAVMAMGNPAALFADLSASRIEQALPPSAPTIQAAADVQAVPPAARDAAANEIVASEPAGKDQAERSETTSEALFRQFQAWAAEQDARAPAALIPPDQDAAARPAQEVPAPAAENVRAPHRLVQKRRQVRSARAELRTQNLRKQVRQAEGARAERPPVQDPRAQDPSAQSAQPPSLLPIFGR